MDNYIEQGKSLAKIHCASCHAFPESDLLDRQTWMQRIIPNMGPRMGFQRHNVYEYPPLPAGIPMVKADLTQAEWELIVLYYLRTSPEKIADESESELLPAATQFTAKPFQLNFPVTSMLKWLPGRNEIITANAATDTLYGCSPTGEVNWRIKVSSPPVDVHAYYNSLLILTVGFLHPNDDPSGTIDYWDWNSGVPESRTLIDSLYRPVSFYPVETSSDQLQIHVSEYGNNIGRLSLHKLENTKWKSSTVISNQPGNLKVCQVNTGSNQFTYTLYGQGDERVILLTLNQQNQIILEKKVAEYPPSYGSMTLHAADINGDQAQELIVVNGDNYDYSPIFKNYHGIRVYQVDGSTGNLEEDQFIPVYGAADVNFQDYNGDGFQDFIVISNYASFSEHAEKGVILGINDGKGNFKQQYIPIPIKNEWTHLESGDFDQDGDIDVVIGAMNRKAIFIDQGLLDPQDIENQAIWLLTNHVNNQGI